MAFDAHSNFGYSLVATAPSPANSGTTLSVTTGQGALFPAAPFNCTVWPANALPLSTNAEIIRVTSKGAGDNWTIQRTQESTGARSIVVGDQIANTVTVKIITDLEGTFSGYVPYTGATADVDLGSHNIDLAGYEDFTAIANPTSPSAGHVRFHAATTQGFTRFEQDNEAATNLVIGRDNVIIAKNTTASPIAAGKPVYVTGSTGNVPNIDLAKADSLTTLPAIGLTLDTIGANNFGQVMTLGVIANINTAAFLTGAQVYVSELTAGALTATRPSNPNYVARVGSVLVSGTGNGSIFVEIAPFIGNRETGTAVTPWTAAGVVNAVTGFQVNGAAPAGNYLRGDGTNFVSSSTPPLGVVPVGGIIMWSGTIATVPTNWALCDGTANAPGPDLRNMFIVGASADDAGVAKTNLTGSLLQTGGAVSHHHADHVLTQPAISAHIITQPAISSHVITQPAVSDHVITQPTASGHAITQAAVSGHSITQPAVTAHTITQPTASAHVITQPTVSAHGITQPAVNAHVITQPTASAHAITQPTVSAHGITQPAVNAHVITQPTASGHVITQPAISAHSLSTAVSLADHSLSALALSAHSFASVINARTSSSGGTNVPTAISAHVITQPTASAHAITQPVIAAHTLSTNVSLADHTLSAAAVSAHSLSANVSLADHTVSAVSLADHTLSAAAVSAHTLSTNVSLADHTVAPASLADHTLSAAAVSAHTLSTNVSLADHTESAVSLADHTLSATAVSVHALSANTAIADHTLSTNVSVATHTLDTSVAVSVHDTLSAPMPFWALAFIQRIT